jgi:hypothetical protein
MTPRLRRLSARLRNNANVPGSRISRREPGTFRNGHTMTKTPWVMRLPRGLREQPAWVFIGILVTLGGLGFVTGLTESSVSQVVGPVGLRVWGATLLLSGLGVLSATLSAKPALEKLALRALSLCMFVYAGWILTVIDWRRASMSVLLCAVLIGIAEVRIGTLKALYRVAENWQEE